jgi:hypothetical protein
MAYTNQCTDCNVNNIDQFVTDPTYTGGAAFKAVGAGATGVNFPVLTVDMPIPSVYPVGQAIVAANVTITAFNAGTNVAIGLATDWAPFTSFSAANGQLKITATPEAALAGLVPAAGAYVLMTIVAGGITYTVRIGYVFNTDGCSAEGVEKACLVTNFEFDTCGTDICTLDPAEGIVSVTVPAGVADEIGRYNTDGDFILNAVEVAAGIIANGYYDPVSGKFYLNVQPGYACGTTASTIINGTTYTAVGK